MNRKRIALTWQQRGALVVDGLPAYSRLVALCLFWLSRLFVLSRIHAFDYGPTQTNVNAESTSGCLTFVILQACESHGEYVVCLT